jgi:hypothetical protein
LRDVSRICSFIKDNILENKKTNSKNNETAEMNFLGQLAAKTVGGRNTNKGSRKIKKFDS